jgi:hypothetical protein
MLDTIGLLAQSFKTYPTKLLSINCPKGGKKKEKRPQLITVNFDRSN